MYTITVAANKGGTGKTTTAVTLASWYALQGQRVLLVDLDGQGHAGLALGYEPGEKPTMADVLQNKTAMHEAIVQARDNLWLVPADVRMVEAEIALQSRPGRAMLTRSLRQVASNYDLAFIDTSPASALSAITQNGLFAADLVICPVQASPLAVHTLPELHAALLQLQDELGWQGELGMVIPTMVNERRIADDMALRQIHRFCGRRYSALVPTLVPENAALKTASANGQTIWEYAHHCPGAKAYMTIADKLLYKIGVPA